MVAVSWFLIFDFDLILDCLRNFIFKISSRKWVDSENVLRKGFEMAMKFLPPESSERIAPAESLQLQAGVGYYCCR